MIPPTGPVSIEDFKKTHGCYTPFGNPEFGGTSSPNAPFSLSSIYTKEMIPHWHKEYVGDRQDMDDMRGCVASLNRENWKANESHRYPGRTFVYYGNPSGMQTMQYLVMADGASGTSYNDPWGTNIRHLLRGKASSGALGGQNSAVMTTFHFYMEGLKEKLFLQFWGRFTYNGVGPSTDPTPPIGGDRQGQTVTAVEYGDTWAGSDSNVVFSEKYLVNPNGASREYSFRIPFNADRPYKLISLATANHGHPTTDDEDYFRGYYGNFAMARTTFRSNGTTGPSEA